MTDKYLYQNGGVITEKTATVVSAGAANAGQIVALDGSGHLDTTVLPTGVGAEVVTVTASEALAAGAFVNVYNNAGTPAVRNADGSTTGKEANGFVLASVANGAAATVYNLGGINTAVSGATAGPVYLSDTTPGGFKATAPTGSGKTSQRVGTASSATVIETAAYPAIVLA